MMDIRPEKRTGLKLIMEHYSGKQDWSIPEKVVENTAMYKLVVTEMSYQVYLLSPFFSVSCVLQRGKNKL